jgi:exosortase
VTAASLTRQPQTETTLDPPRTGATIPYALLAIFGVLFLGIYASTFVFMMGRWTNDPSATHGWLVIPIAVVVTYYKRERLKALTLSSDRRGLWVMAFALFLHLLELFFDMNGPSPLSIPIFVAGAVWYFAGTAWLRELAFPIGYLLFMLPIPGFLNQFVSFPLRLLATNSSKAIVEHFGIQINGAGMNMEFWRPGSDHTNPERDFVSLVVADPCSGLHSLMAIKALHAITAYLSRLKLGWKWVLFMCALPISLAANICRLVLIILVSAYVNKQFGLDAFHHWSPYILFIFVFLILFSIGRFMEWATGATRKSPPNSSPDGPSSGLPAADAPTASA